MTNSKDILQHNLDYTFFSWSKQGGLNPINVASAEGVYLYDTDGKRYIDFSSQLMNVNIGHGRPEVAHAVAQQMTKLNFVAPSMATEPRGLLGKKLAEVSPGDLTKTFFTLGGAEAIENAIKIARVYTGKHKIISQYRSYHGATYGAITAGGDPRRHPVDTQQAPNIVHVDNPYSYRCPWYSSSPEECGERAIKNLEQVILYESPDTIAAILMEGESGSSGCIKYPPFYLKKVRALCDKYNILMIDDEVMSGFGRTGKYFAIEHHDVTPDIMCMAKGLTAGYLPLGAMIVRPDIAAAFETQKLPLGLTYSAHAVSCAAALAVLDIYEQDNLVERAAEMGQYLDAQVELMKAKHPSIGDWRNTGLLGCFELVKNRTTKEPMCPWNGSSEVMNNVAAKIRALGMFTFVKWNFIFVAPPLSITKEQIDEGLAIISQAIAIADEQVV
ncbi:aminotransferase class III-fold pyridoxal phosphate-dependent enzyme [Aureispira anguillae]|uniref:Aminotransferase class III-fold pyridoxal phosphate-dependent enzyme n=1 Tax=Aureispira anguillae TaxID=2864201 RepID=A0A916DXT0_9BACT|nr:aminotransferase class III-fold pyridoxal phosphate-dependent enzyme [Aureispira anguillae]BDS15371.1 aminotransferase class III-fold pyridoxal phosphate-dependent enzyme [Aureispira anguillae]